MAKEKKSKSISIRLPESMLFALNEQANKKEESRTELIRRAIEEHLKSPTETPQGKVERLKESCKALEREAADLEGQIEASKTRSDDIESVIEQMYSKIVDCRFD